MLRWLVTLTPYWREREKEMLAVIEQKDARILRLEASLMQEQRLNASRVDLLAQYRRTLAQLARQRLEEMALNG